jgi:hypothetical protein
VRCRNGGRDEETLAALIPQYHGQIILSLYGPVDEEEVIPAVTVYISNRTNTEISYQIIQMDGICDIEKSQRF